MKRFAVLAFTALSISACATRTEQPLTTLAQARAGYIATCGEVLRLKQGGVDLPTAREGCIKADDILDAADAAYTAGRLAEAATGANRALVYITAAQALVVAASNGKVK